MDGTISHFGLSDPYGIDIVTGPDSNLCFTVSYTDQVGRITPSGQQQIWDVDSQCYPQTIAAGPDRPLWFGCGIADEIGRITTSGSITYYPSRATKKATSWRASPAGPGAACSSRSSGPAGSGASPLGRGVLPSISSPRNLSGRAVPVLRPTRQAPSEHLAFRIDVFLADRGTMQAERWSDSYL